MQESSLISGYAELLARELSFDQSLARRVRQEVEDHLREAVAAARRDGILDAERQTIAKFGNPHVLAAQFALLSLAKHTARAGAGVILTIAGVFIAMKARVEWYAATQWTMSDDLRSLSRTIVIIDRYAFWFSVFVGISAWVRIHSRPAAAAFCAVYHKHLRRCFLLCAAATAALIASVISDGVLTALRLSGARLSPDFLVPIVSMAIEIAGASVLVFWIRSMMQRTAAAMIVLLRT
jgi:hypothetical protein